MHYAGRYCLGNETNSMSLVVFCGYSQHSVILVTNNITHGMQLTHDQNISNSDVDGLNSK